MNSQREQYAQELREKLAKRQREENMRLLKDVILTLVTTIVLTFPNAYFLHLLEPERPFEQALMAGFVMAGALSIPICLIWTSVRSRSNYHRNKSTNIAHGSDIR